MEWLGEQVPMETLSKPDTLVTHLEYYLAQLEEEDLGVDVNSFLTMPILEAKYQDTNIVSVIKQCTHLNQFQKAGLCTMLEQHTKLFDGTLGKYPGEPMRIELEPHAQPVYRRPYPIP